MGLLAIADGAFQRIWHNLVFTSFFFFFSDKEMAQMADVVVCWETAECVAVAGVLAPCVAMLLAVTRGAAALYAITRRTGR